MLKRVDNKLVDTKKEDDAAWFFMEWCNRPDVERFRGGKNDEMMDEILWNLKNNKYDELKFKEIMMENERFKLEYEEFEDMVESKKELAELKIQDILENDYDRMVN